MYCACHEEPCQAFRRDSWTRLGNGIILNNEKDPLLIRKWVVKDIDRSKSGKYFCKAGNYMAATKVIVHGSKYQTMFLNLFKMFIRCQELLPHKVLCTPGGGVHNFWLDSALPPSFQKGTPSITRPGCLTLPYDDFLAENCPLLTAFANFCETHQCLRRICRRGPFFGDFRAKNSPICVAHTRTLKGTLIIFYRAIHLKEVPIVSYT